MILSWTIHWTLIVFEQFLCDLDLLAINELIWEMKSVENLLFILFLFYFSNQVVYRNEEMRIYVCALSFDMTDKVDCDVYENVRLSKLFLLWFLLNSFYCLLITFSLKNIEMDKKNIQSHSKYKKLQKSTFRNIWYHIRKKEQKRSFLINHSFNRIHNIIFISCHCFFW